MKKFIIKEFIYRKPHKKVLYQAIVKPVIALFLLVIFIFSVAVPAFAQNGYRSDNKAFEISGIRQRIESTRKARQTMADKIKISNDLVREMMVLKTVSKSQLDDAKKMVSYLRKTKLAMSGKQVAATKEILILLKEEKGKLQIQEENLRAIRIRFRANRRQFQYMKSIEDLDRLIPAQQEIIEQLKKHQKVMTRLLSVLKN